MTPVINSELQRLLIDSAEFKLEVRISEKDEVEFWMVDNNTGIEKLMSSGSGYERTIASLALERYCQKYVHYQNQMWWYLMRYSEKYQTRIWKWFQSFSIK
jgi:DNA repair ATPase RecN